MVDKPPLILEIKGNSLDDGPGIRTVVFFKGCPLSCAWCHNPESKNPRQEISFDQALCVDCGTCLSVCGENALSRENPGYVDRERCTLCFACEESCPSGALSRVGRKMGVSEIAGEVEKDLPFFQASGGGATLSGGEPTLHMDLAGDLARSLREKGVHVLLETCGLFDFRRFSEKLLPHLDAIYMDLKIMNPKRHSQACGVPNRTILENFRRLAEFSRQGGPSILARVPLVPGYTADKENLLAVADFLRGIGLAEISLLPYNPLWKDKTVKIGTGFADDLSESWMSREEIEECRASFPDFTIQG
ncbi:MAG: glycyl-radical enzyme activating protein [Proteobacteria bacterium]|nr:glycyl-radical enzyme activating protein [Pseudomonadota bacterium]